MWHLEEAPAGPALRRATSWPPTQMARNGFFCPNCSKMLSLSRHVRSASRSACAPPVVFFDRYEPLEHLRTVRTKIARAPWLG
jgi:hypothetical protein